MTDHGAMTDVDPGLAWGGSLLVRSLAVVWLAAAALVPGAAESRFLFGQATTVSGRLLNMVKAGQLIFWLLQ